MKSLIATILIAVSLPAFAEEKAEKPAQPTLNALIEERIKRYDRWFDEWTEGTEDMPNQKDYIQSEAAARDSYKALARQILKSGNTELKRAFLTSEYNVEISLKQSDIGWEEEELILMKHQLALKKWQRKLEQLADAKDE